MAYDKPERSTPLEYKWIIDKLDIPDASVMDSDNGEYLWVRVTRSGHSFSHRLQKNPEPQHIETAKRFFTAWWQDERSPEDMLAETLDKRGE